MAVAQAAMERVEPAPQEPAETKATRTAAQAAEPPLALTDRAISASIERFGTSEASARLPLALLGVLTVLFVFLLGSHLGDSSAGLIASIACLASPLIIFQSRQLQSDIPAIAGQLVFAMAIAGICLRPPPKKSSLPLLLFSLVLFVVGGWVAWKSAGLVYGCLPPLLAASLGGLVVLFDGSKVASEVNVRQRVLLGTLVTLSCSAIIIFFAKQEISLLTALPDKTPIPFSEILGGVWKTQSKMSLTFNQMHESIAFGLGPWIAVAPIACLMLLGSAESSRERFAISFLFLWVAFSWSIGSYLEFRVDAQTFLAMPSLSIAIGLWLQKLFAGRRLSATPLIAIFIGIAGIVIAKDVAAFPEKLLGVHLDAFPKEFPEGPKTYRIASILMALFSMLLALGLGLRNAPIKNIKQGFIQTTVQWAARFAIPCALLLSVAYTFFIAQVWPRKLDQRLSSRQTYDTLNQLRQEGEEFAIVGRSKKGAAFYAGKDHTKLKGRHDLIEYLKKPERNFALIRSSERCPLYKQSRKGSFDFFVVDNSNPDLSLISNRMIGGKSSLPKPLFYAMRQKLDLNPMVGAVRKTKPDLITTPLNVVYGSKLELVGTSIPERVSAGDEFEALLVYKVLKPISRDWKIFLHFDGPIRFQGDHPPLDDGCGTRHWAVGDYIVDRTTVKAGSAKSSYAIWTGLFSGSAGNWTNMETTHQAGDEKHRVKIGTIIVE